MKFFALLSVLLMSMSAHGGLPAHSIDELLNGLDSYINFFYSKEDMTSEVVSRLTSPNEKISLETAKAIVDRHARTSPRYQQIYKILVDHVSNKYSQQAFNEVLFVENNELRKYWRSELSRKANNVHYHQVAKLGEKRMSLATTLEGLEDTYNIIKNHIEYSVIVDKKLIEILDLKQSPQNICKPEYRNILRDRIKTLKRNNGFFISAFSKTVAQEHPQALPFIAACVITDEDLDQFDKVELYKDIFNKEMYPILNETVAWSTGVIALLANKKTAVAKMPADIKAKLNKHFYSFLKVATAAREFHDHIKIVLNSKWYTEPAIISNSLQPKFLRKAFINHKIDIPSVDEIPQVAYLFFSDRQQSSRFVYSDARWYIGEPAITGEWLSLNPGEAKYDEQEDLRIANRLEFSDEELATAANNLKKACRRHTRDLAQSAIEDSKKYWRISTDREGSSDDENFSAIVEPEQIASYCTEEVYNLPTNLTDLRELMERHW